MRLFLNSKNKNKIFTQTYTCKIKNFIDLSVNIYDKWIHAPEEYLNIYDQQDCIWDIWGCTYYSYTNINWYTQILRYHHFGMFQYIEISS